MSSRDAFPDNRFSASSSISGNEASKGRLNGVGAWSPSTDGNANDYLQIKLHFEFIICAVATQGKSSANEWTEEYKLHLSLSGTSWDTYQENNVDKVCLSPSGMFIIGQSLLTSIVCILHLAEIYSMKINCIITRKIHESLSCQV